jgi:hypothetical protein
MRRMTFLHRAFVFAMLFLMAFWSPVRGEDEDAKPKKSAPRSTPAIKAADESSDEEMPDEEKPTKKRPAKSAAKDKAGKSKKEDAKKETTKVDHTGDGRVYEKSIAASIVPPEGWTRGPAAPNTKLSFFAPEAAKLHANMNLTVSKDDGIEYEKVVEGIKVELPQVLAGWKLTGRGKAKLQGRPAYYCTSTFRVQDSDAQQLQYFVRGDTGIFYCLTFTADKESFPELKQEFQDCAKTFRCD